VVILLVIVVLTLTIVGFFVIRQFQKVGDRLDTEQEQNISDISSISKINNNLTSVDVVIADLRKEDNVIHTDAASFSNQILTAIGGLTSKDLVLSESYDTFSSNVGTLNSRLDGMYTTLDDSFAYLSAPHVSASNVLLSNRISFGKSPSTAEVNVSHDPIKGMTINNITPDPAYDLSVNRLNVNKGINVGGSLNFASINNSYMLGIDGTGMFLQMLGTPGIAAGPGGAGAFIVRDSTNTNRMVVDATGTKAIGNMDITGKITGTQQVCINSTCLDEADVGRLKQILATPAAVPAVPTVPTP